MPVKTTSSVAEIIAESGRFALRGSRAILALEVADDLWPAEVERQHHVHINRGRLARVVNRDVDRQNVPKGNRVRTRPDVNCELAGGLNALSRKANRERRRVGVIRGYREHSFKAALCIRRENDIYHEVLARPKRYRQTAFKRGDKHRMVRRDGLDGEGSVANVCDRYSFSPVLADVNLAELQTGLVGRDMRRWNAINRRRIRDGRRGLHVARDVGADCIKPVSPLPSRGAELELTGRSGLGKS